MKVIWKCFDAADCNRWVEHCLLYDYLESIRIGSLEARLEIRLGFEQDWSGQHAEGWNMPRIQLGRVRDASRMTSETANRRYFSRAMKEQKIRYRQIGITATALGRCKRTP